MFEDSGKTKAFLKIAAFGDGGSGKTRFLLSFPDVAVVDTERGTNPYRGKYEFKVKHINKWRDLDKLLGWIEKNPGVFGTLAIDSLTVFYQDLVNDLVEYVKNKRNQEVLSQAEWTIIKRRWASFLNRLVDLPCHVILSMRERDEFEETVNYKGEEVRKKTGNHLMDADKQTQYIFDLVLRLYTEENRKTKESKHLIQVKKTRYDWMPKYSIYDITGKRAFPELFESHMAELEEGEIARPRNLDGETPQEPETKPEGTGEVASTSEAVGDILRKFVAPAADESEPNVSGEDVKVLMTRCGQLAWPDGEEFKSSDGKIMIKALFKLESSKDLKKSQADWLYAEFGKVLAGHAKLARDEKGIPFIQAVTATAEAKT